jgi:hypothetical protein
LAGSNLLSVYRSPLRLGDDARERDHALDDVGEHGTAQPRGHCPWPASYAGATTTNRTTSSVKTPPQPQSVPHRMVVTLPSGWVMTVFFIGHS